MANYKQTDIAGEKWTRCGSITISNTHNSTPAIRYDEEVVINIGESQPIYRQAGIIQQQFDPAKVIPLINPETGESIGTMTFADVYVALYSAYMSAAADRDEQNQL